MTNAETIQVLQAGKARNLHKSVKLHRCSNGSSVVLRHPGEELAVTLKLTTLTLRKVQKTYFRVL